MNGIVVEKNHDSAVALSDDGIFVILKNDNYEIGERINMKKKKGIATKLVASVAGIAAALVLCTIGGLAYYTPVDYVSLDVNPSIEYSVNMFDRVVDVKAVNEDGEEIVSTLDLKNMSLEEAVKQTLDKLISEGYLTDDENGGVIITTSNDEDNLEEAKLLADSLGQEIQAYLDDKEDVVAKVEAEAVGLERVKEARKLGVTPGKLNLVEKLQASTTGAINIDEWLDKPVKEINKAIKENREQEREKEQNNNGKDKDDLAEDLDEDSEDDDVDEDKDDLDEDIDDDSDLDDDSDKASNINNNSNNKDNEQKELEKNNNANKNAVEEDDEDSDDELEDSNEKVKTDDKPDNSNGNSNSSTNGNGNKTKD